MKKISFLLMAFALTVFVACTSKSSSDDKAKDNKENTEKPAVTNGAAATPSTEGAAAASLKEHVCTDKCKDGAHLYAHGEKGHGCTEECMKKEGAMNDHKCTDNCKEGACVYAHGEKGHACTGECKKAA